MKRYSNPIETSVNQICKSLKGLRFLQKINFWFRGYLEEEDNLHSYNILAVEKFLKKGLFFIGKTFKKLPHLQTIDLHSQSVLTISNKGFGDFGNDLKRLKSLQAFKICFSSSSS